MLEDDAGDIVRKARLGSGRSRDEVAISAGLSPATLASLETLERAMTPAEARDLARALSLDPPALEAIALGLYRPAHVPEHVGGVEIVTLLLRQTDGWTSNCYLVAQEGAQEALIVDPGGEPDRILDALDARGWRPRHVLVTHGHRDHVGALAAIHAEWAVSVLAGVGDADCIPLPRDSVHWLRDGETLPIGSGELQALQTPGHTPGGFSFRLDGHIFVGDALFAGSIGNPNVPRVGYGQLLSSLSRHVLSLSEPTVVHPGHGPATTVGEERRHNPFFAGRAAGVV